MTKIIQIGNSQGIRIPKSLIEQAKLQNCDIELSVVKNGLLLSPKQNKVRENWDSESLRILAKKESLQNLNTSYASEDYKEWDW